MTAPNLHEAAAFLRMLGTRHTFQTFDDAKTSVQLRVDVRARRTLFVYVESKAGADLALTIIDPAVTKPICSEAQPHGYQACKWRPGRAATGIVEIRNDGNASVSALLIARQS